MPNVKHPVYSVLGLDLGVTETDLVIGDDHFNVIEVFHTSDAEEAMLKLDEFNKSFPKALVTNNAIFAHLYYEYQIEEMKKQYPELVRTEG
ncbi:hypothetical protein [Acinetobacter oleivorans]|uniref:hypothetical protein n=1 Tax=Acinetobacter oleivorans TaxID=1148157 RepID=UPI00124FB742|nr:hypothetical protein [Acinetobacter oleivorans]